MGSAGYHRRDGREGALGEVVSGEYKYIIAVVGVNLNTNKPTRGGYRLFKELDEPAIQKYAHTTSAENGVALEKIEIFSLEAKLLQELKP
ncbi:MAG TPA: hypothetical protein VJA23_01470 [Candidatus Nanoarchaeia archaeon]|nr:hypothetical protein [Candidatus Nanoarchaeia archaeon]